MTSANHGATKTARQVRAATEVATQHRVAQLIAAADAIERAVAVETSASRRVDQIRAIREARTQAAILSLCLETSADLRHFSEQLRQDRRGAMRDTGPDGRCLEGRFPLLLSDITMAPPCRHSARGLDR